MDRLDESRARLAAAPTDTLETGMKQLGSVLWDAIWRLSRESGMPSLVAYVDGEQYAELFAHAPADIAHLLDEVARLREQLAHTDAVVAATERYLELSSDCDYVGGEPDVCPGVAENGGPCHWCDMRQAVAAYRASAAPAESERGEGE